jgi:hypothetical protein
MNAINTNIQPFKQQSDDARGRMVRDLEWFLSREMTRASQVGAKVVAWPTAFVGAIRTFGGGMRPAVYSAAGQQG